MGECECRKAWAGCVAGRAGVRPEQRSVEVLEVGGWRLENACLEREWDRGLAGGQSATKEGGMAGGQWSMTGEAGVHE